MYSSFEIICLTLGCGALFLRLLSFVVNVFDVIMVPYTTLVNQKTQQQVKMEAGISQF